MGSGFRRNDGLNRLMRRRPHALPPGLAEIRRRLARQRRQHGDVGVAAQAEQVFDASVLEVLDELVRDELLHGVAFGSSVRGAGPVSR